MGVTRNLMSDIINFGFVPNGGRIYYLNRSQPPVLSEMVMALLQDDAGFGKIALTLTFRSNDTTNYIIMSLRIVITMMVWKAWVLVAIYMKAYVLGCYTADVNFLGDALSALEIEYQFWMRIGEHAVIMVSVILSLGVIIACIYYACMHVFKISTFSINLTIMV